MRLLLLIHCLLIFGCSVQIKSEQIASDSTEVAFDSLTSVETEAEETQRLEEEASGWENDLDAYNGRYILYTESEGAEGSLTLKYLGNKEFKFSLRMDVLDLCEGELEGTALVDRSQHAFYPSDNCLIHFNLFGQNIEIEEPAGCNAMKGDCSFTGTYQFQEG